MPSLPKITMSLSASCFSLFISSETISFITTELCRSVFFKDFEKTTFRELLIKSVSSCRFLSSGHIIGSLFFTPVLHCFFPISNCFCNVNKFLSVFGHKAFLYHPFGSFSVGFTPFAFFCISWGKCQIVTFSISFFT